MSDGLLSDVRLCYFWMLFTCRYEILNTRTYLSSHPKSSVASRVNTAAVYHNFVWSRCSRNSEFSAADPRGCEACLVFNLLPFLFLSMSLSIIFALSLACISFRIPDSSSHSRTSAAILVESIIKLLLIIYHNRNLLILYRHETKMRSQVSYYGMLLFVRKLRAALNRKMHFYVTQSWFVLKWQEALKSWNADQGFITCSSVWEW